MRGKAEREPERNPSDTDTRVGRVLTTRQVSQDTGVWSCSCELSAAIDDLLSEWVGGGRTRVKVRGEGGERSRKEPITHTGRAGSHNTPSTRVSGAARVILMIEWVGGLRLPAQPVARARPVRVLNPEEKSPPLARQSPSRRIPPSSIRRRAAATSRETSPFRRPGGFLARNPALTAGAMPPLGKIRRSLSACRCWIPSPSPLPPPPSHRCRRRAPRSSTD